MSGSRIVAWDTSNESKGGLGFLIVLRSTPVASEDDLEVSSSFSSSIALKGSFRLDRLRSFFFFFLAGSSSEEEDEEDSSESYPVFAGIFFFFFGVSVSDSDSDSDSEELKESDRSFFFCFLRLILLTLKNRL